MLALLLFLISPVMLLRTPVDIFPSINIPVISVIWTYTGLVPSEMEPHRLDLRTVSHHHRQQHRTHRVAIVERRRRHQSISAASGECGWSDRAGHGGGTGHSQAIAAGHYASTGTQYSASSVPILQLGLSGKGLSEQQLNDLG